MHLACRIRCRSTQGTFQFLPESRRVPKLNFLRCWTIIDGIKAFCSFYTFHRKFSGLLPPAGGVELGPLRSAVTSAVRIFRPENIPDPKASDSCIQRTGDIICSAIEASTVVNEMRKLFRGAPENPGVRMVPPRERQDRRAAPLRRGWVIGAGVGLRRPRENAQRNRLTNESERHRIRFLFPFFCTKLWEKAGDERRPG